MELVTSRQERKQKQKQKPEEWNVIWSSSGNVRASSQSSTSNREAKKRKEISHRLRSRRSFHLDAKLNRGPEAPLRLTELIRLPWVRAHTPSDAEDGPLTVSLENIFGLQIQVSVLQILILLRSVNESGYAAFWPGSNCTGKTNCAQGSCGTHRRMVPPIPLWLCPKGSELDREQL